MEITDIKMRLTKGDRKVKAYTTIVFDKCLVVHNIKVISGCKGFFIAMPSTTGETSKYEDVAHPTNADFRLAMQNRIVDEYKSVLKNGNLIVTGG